MHNILLASAFAGSAFVAQGASLPQVANSKEPARLPGKLMRLSGGMDLLSGLLGIPPGENSASGAGCGLFSPKSATLDCSPLFGPVPPPPPKFESCEHCLAEELSSFRFKQTNTTQPFEDVRFIQGLFAIPNIDKHITSYLYSSSMKHAELPFFGPIPNGPSPQGCKPYELIIARGFGEVGTYGFIVGDPLLERVQKDLPDVQGYAVQYPASSEPDSLGIGINDMVSRLNSQSKKCPKTKFALVGYSQGALAMRGALNGNKIDLAVLKTKIVGGATFGDPYLGRNHIWKVLQGVYKVSFMENLQKFPEAFDAKVKTNCAVSWGYTDLVCDSSDVQPNLENPFATFSYNNPGNKYIEDTAAHLIKLFKGSQSS